LVISGSPTEGEQVQAQRAAALASPEAVLSRAESETAYESLSVQESQEVDDRLMGEVIDEPDGGPPKLPAGQRVSSFSSPFSAALELPEGGRGALNSLAPIAVEDSSSKRLVPIDLTPRQTGSGFEASTPATGMHVRVGGRLSEGASLSDIGITLTPVSEDGASLEGSGVIDAASVFYGDSEDAQAGVLDVDSLIKLGTYGFSEETILRSRRSPQKLFFKVGMPEGASLVQAQEGSGVVRVIHAGQTVARIVAPSGRDVEGTVVPLSLGVSGDLLTLSVEHGVGQYRLPIEVDPTIEDTTLLLSGNWAFGTNSTDFVGYEEILEYHAIGVKSNPKGGKYESGQYGIVQYPTQHESRIYKFFADSEQFDNRITKQIEPYVFVANSKKEIETNGGKPTVLPFEGASETTLCVESGCATGSVAAHHENFAELEEYATTSGEGGFAAQLKAGTFVAIAQEKGPAVSVDTTDAMFGSAPNGAYPGQWVNGGGKVGTVPVDPGIGISAASYSSPQASGWGHGLQAVPGCQGAQCDECWNYASRCESGHSTSGEPLTYSLSGLPDGKDTVEVKVENATGETASISGTVSMDSTPPHSIALSGLGPGGQVGAGEYHLKAEATDGSGSTPSSGVKSLALYIDGHEVGSPSGSCTEGPCTAHGEWTIFGHEYATGRHTATVLATDNAGNTSSESFTMTVHPADPLALGPGAVNPQSGEFSLSATDVSMGGGLTVGRSYGSQHLTAGAGGPLGPQWSVAMGGQESLVKQPDGSMVLTDSAGAQTIFAPDGKGGFISPVGDSNLTLSSTPCETGKSEDMLKNAAAKTTTCFAVPPSGSGEVWAPSLVQGTAPSDTVIYRYETAEVPKGSGKKLTRPREALAPVPAGVTCSFEVKPTELQHGCRVLTFNYAETTTAKGEAPAEWGDVEGQLTRVYYTGYDPVSKGMHEVEVAHYLYDKRGRLRAEWDPRISPALKTTYGYDTESHVTALSQPGQQPWLFTYGMLSGDAHTGRLMSVTRPSASTLLGSGVAPVNSEAPKLSTTNPKQGTEVTVSTGGWTNSPGAYGYQWEHCNETGGECAPITGAVNPGYTPRYSDEEHTLRATVTATNSGGSTSASSTLSAVVPAKEFPPTFQLEFGSLGTEHGQFKGPSYAAVSGGSVYVSDTGNNRIQTFSSNGSYSATIGSVGTGSGQFKEPTGVAAYPASNGYLWVVDAGNKRIQWFNGGSFKHEASVSPGEAEALAGASVSPGIDSMWENQWVAKGGTSPGIDQFLAVEGIGELHGGVFGSVGTGNGQLKEPSAVAWYPQAEWLLVADTANNRVQAFEASGKYVNQFGSLGTGNGQFKGPKGIAVDSKGDVWVADTGNNRIEEFAYNSRKSNWQYLAKFGIEGTSQGQFKTPLGMASEGSIGVYVVDSANNRVQKLTPHERPADPPLPPPNPPNPGSSSVWTVEYQVPVSGTGAPYAMGKSEVEKWGQNDLPVEASAIFPPDEPMGWPAKDYRRATVYYRDSTERTVNVATPSGGISTSEYNANNDVVRGLTADNRASALKEEAKSAEVAGKLDTQSEYNSEGTELLSTLGPRHTVKLSNGKEVQARSHTVYHYDEGAPTEGGPYRLVTKTTQGAQTETEGEQDVRTTVTSYSGQNGLGWKLRGPTAVTTDPNGLALTHTTTYDEATGNVIESTTPAGNAPNQSPTYSTSFGSYGVEAGHLRGPEGMATDLSGNVWVTDSLNSRIEEWNAKGEFVRAVGSEGTGNGQFQKPTGIATDSKGDVWVSDTEHFRVEEFSSEGVWIRTCGSYGSGNDQFYVPEGLRVDSSGHVWVADRGNNRIEELDSECKYIRSITKGAESPYDVALDSSGNVWVTYEQESQVAEFTAEGSLIRAWGTKGTGTGQIFGAHYLSIGPGGDIWLVEYENDRVQVFTPTGEYLYGFGSKGSASGQFLYPDGIAISGSNVYVLDSGVFWENTGNSRIEKWSQAESASIKDTHDTQTIYYSSKEEASVAACRNHPEWANLPCQTQPAKQPETSGLPNLPVTTITSYNMLDEPLSTTSTVGTSTRTTTMTYDEAGRTLTSETASTVGTSLPKVTDKYEEHTGALIEQSTTTGSLKSEFNPLGQLTSYTDADGNTTKYEYEGEGSYQGEKEKDGRLKHVDDGKGAQAYTYDETTGALTKLVDTQGTHALTFTASYDVEGNMTNEGYPNGMSADYTLNQAGETTALSYVKTTNCSENCTWFSDTAVLSIHRQWMTQQSSLASESYTYDQAGRLTQTLENVGSEGCTTRIYAYDEETNRLSLTTRPPGAGGACSAEGGSVEAHSYDPANRLVDAGTAYEPFGETAKLSASDAGGGSELQSTFYVDGQLHEQKQGEQTVGYELDPAGRARRTTDTGTVNSTYTSHYAGSGGSPSWTVEPVSGHWTRYVTGIGGFAAIETDTTEPVLQLADLQGNIVARASISETATKLLATERPTEYGVPTSTKPEKYSWLGSDMVPTELPSGVVATGARSYVSRLGRFLQTDPVPGGSANAYAYTYGDPVNTSDPSGEYTAEVNGAGMEVASEAGAGIAAERRVAEEAAARAEAEQKAAEAAFWSQGVASEAPEPEEAIPAEVMVLTLHLGGGGHGKRARAANFSLKAAFNKVEKVVSSTFKKARTAVEAYGNELWEDVNSELFQKSLECVKGANDLYEKLEGENWKEYPLVVASIYLVGCAGGTEDVEWG
jgi:RHS repeat-associated protein